MQHKKIKLGAGDNSVSAPIFIGKFNKNIVLG